MAKQSQQQQRPGEGLSDQQQEALVHIGKMMGPHATGFDARVQAMHDEAHAEEHANTDYEKAFADFPHEASAAKMQAARTAGSTGLGPTEAEQALAKQQGALQQQSAAAGAQRAAQAQSQQTSVAPPPAPAGPQGTTAPYRAQKGTVGGPGTVQAPPSAPVGPQEPEPEEEPGSGEEP
jgi:hypothetical protein